ncbi:pyridoxamine 5'-phosphate oxidase [Bacteroidota bacterium]
MPVDIATIRNEYSKRSVTKDNLADDPVDQFKVWMDEAVQAEVYEPTAMTLATADQKNQPSTRVVLLKGIVDGKIYFYTNYNSRKGNDILENPKVAITFFWAEIERQVNINGIAEKVSEQESDAYFDSRPYSSRVGAWASPQSSVITNRAFIMKEFLKYSTKFAGRKVPRPPHWGGYAVIPDLFIFWQGRPSRLHDRIRYTRQENNDWYKERLAP